MIAIWSITREAQYVRSGDGMITGLCEAQYIRSGDCVISILSKTREAQYVRRGKLWYLACTVWGSVCRSGNGMITDLHCVRIGTSKVGTVWYPKFNARASLCQKYVRCNIWPALCDAQYARRGDGMISVLHSVGLSMSGVGTLLHANEKDSRPAWQNTFDVIIPTPPNRQHNVRKR
jgi:hypothetical protein